MTTEFSKIISDVNQAKKKAKRGRKPIHGERRERARKVPEYENIADWRGIETALESVRLDQATPAGAETPRFISFDLHRDTTAASPFPYTPARQGTRSGVYADSMGQAISSAMEAMRPQLLQMAKGDAPYASGEKAPSTETLSQYRVHFNGLIAQYQRHTGLRDAENIDWIKFADWFIARQADLSSGTWRVYRAALAAQLERIPSDDAATALSLVHSIDNLDSKKDDLESSRMKLILPADYDRILYHCCRNPSLSNTCLANYLRANVRVGLRPIEYLTSEVRVIPDKNAPYERQVWMFVCNAKYSRVRANGPVRLLDLSPMDDRAITVIRDCIDETKMGRKAHLNESVR